MSDDRIGDVIQSCAKCDRASFRLLYRDASTKLMGVLLRILSERPEAEDALQEAYTRIWLRAAKYDPAKGRGMTWLIALARNLTLDRLRRRPPRTSDDWLYLVVDVAPLAQIRLIAHQDAARLSACFDQLEPERGEAVRGAYLSGLSCAELSGQYAVPLNTLRAWLRRGLLKLRECLDQ